MQLKPQRMPARNVAIRKDILPIKNIISPDIARMVFNELPPLLILKLFIKDGAKSEMKSNLFLLLSYAFLVANLFEFNS